jgi:hypothetical protein
MDLLLAIVRAIRWRLLGFPLERDDGEYAYMGRVILEGGSRYGEAANMKWPETCLAYAVTMGIFGQTTVGSHTGLLLVSIASSLLLFGLGRRVGGPICEAAGIRS